MAVNVDTVPAGGPATNVMTCVACTDPTVAVTVSACAVAEDNLAVNTPELLVVPEVGEKTLLLPLAAKLTGSFTTGLPWASFTVSVNVVVLLPSARRLVGLAVKVVVALEGGPATKVTCAVCCKPAKDAVTFLTSATVAASVVVTMPTLLVVPVVGLRV